MKTIKSDLKFYAMTISVFSIFQFGILLYVITDKTKQSKQHHENYHKLLKENARLNDWYQNHDCEVSYEPCQVVVECEIK